MSDVSAAGPPQGANSAPAGGSAAATAASVGGSLPKMLNIEVDGRAVQVPQGSTVLDAANKLGIYVPHFCYHKKLSIAANCRMMLDVNFDTLRQHFKSYLPIGVAVGILVLFEMALVIADSAIGRTVSAPPPPAGSNTRALGRLLYVDYVYPFEIAAVVLLVAIVAAIALTHRERKERKHQDPSRQVKVRREDRVRLVNLRSEKPPA